MSSDRGRDELDKGITRAISNFLFGRGKTWNDSQNLEMRTRVGGENTMKGFTYLGVLRDNLKSKVAESTINSMMRFAVSIRGGGRTEGVTIAKGRLPKETTIPTGFEPELLDMEDSEA